MPFLMNLFQSLPVYALPLAVGVIALVLGWVAGRASGRKSGPPAAWEPETDTAEEEGDPTAPIVLMIEMA
jgi:hypothetical protein